jgi:hypothetical protein
VNLIVLWYHRLNLVIDETLLESLLEALMLLLLLLRLLFLGSLFANCFDNGLLVAAFGFALSQSGHAT